MSSYNTRIINGIKVCVLKDTYEGEKIIDDPNKLSSIEKMFHMMLHTNRNNFESQGDIVDQIKHHFENYDNSFITQSTISKLLKELPLYIEYHNSYYVIYKEGRRYVFNEISEHNIGNNHIDRNSESLNAIMSERLDFYVEAYCQISDHCIMIRCEEERSGYKIVNELHEMLPRDILVDARLLDNQITGETCVLVMLNSRYKRKTKRYMDQLIQML